MKNNLVVRGLLTMSLPGSVIAETLMKRRLVGRVVLMLFATTLVSCSSTTEQGTVGVQRSQLLPVSSAELDQAAAPNTRRSEIRGRASATLR